MVRAGWAGVLIAFAGAGCSFGGGPVVGIRGGKPTIGWEAGPGLVLAGGDGRGAVLGLTGDVAGFTGGCDLRTVTVSIGLRAVGQGQEAYLALRFDAGQTDLCREPDEY